MSNTKPKKRHAWTPIASAMVMALVAATVIQAAIPTPVAYWPMRDGAPGTTVAGADDLIDDPSHPATDATINNANATWEADPLRGIVFSTVEGNRLDAGQQGINLNVDSGWTWSIWAKVDSSNVTDPGADVLMGTRAGSWNKMDRTGCSNWINPTYPDMADDTWHHWIFVGDVTGGSIYRDGVFQSKDTTFNSPGALGDKSTLKLEIGGTSQYSEDVTALISDVAVWNVALTPTQITELYNGSNVITDTTAPYIVYTTPDDDDGNASKELIQVIFDEPIVVGSGNIRIVNDTDVVTTTIAVTDGTQVTVSGAQITIDPTVALIVGKSYHIEMDAGGVKNVEGFDFAGIGDSTTWNFTVDATPPTVSSIDDNVGGGPIYEDRAEVTYTVTFNEPIDGTTVDTSDFDNAGGATINIASVTQTSPEVFTVVVEPSSTGTLQLRIPTGSVVKDVSGNSLVVPVTDGTISINAGSDPGTGDRWWDPNSSGVTDGASGGGAGTWSTSDAEWDRGVGFDATVAWNNSNSDSAIFGGTPAAVTLSGSATVSNVTFTSTSGGYDIQGGTLNFVSGATIRATDNRHNHTFSCTITGSPAVETKDYGAGNQYEGLIFAPGSGHTQTLGTVVNPNNSGDTDKAGVYLSGSTVGNSVASVMYAGGDRFGTVYVQGTGSWTAGDILTGTLRISGGNLVMNGEIDTDYNGFYLTGGVLHYNNAGAVKEGAFHLNGGALDNSSGSAITTSTYDPAYSIGGNVAFIGSNGASSDLNLGTGAVTLSGATRTVTVQNSAATLTLGGIIGDGGNAYGLTKAGDGTLVLGGANTHTGPTTVNAGNLRVTGSLDVGSAVTIDGGTLQADGSLPFAGTVAVNSGGTLGGAGTVGIVSVASGGAVAPGASTGTLGASNVTMVSGSTLSIEIDDGQDPKNDTLAVSNSLDITDATLDFNVTGSPAGFAYVIATYGSLTGTFGTITDIPLGYTIDYAYGGNVIAIKQSGGETQPACTNRGVANIDIGTATLRGELTAGSTANAYICWGGSDGGTSSTGDWDNVEIIGPVTAGAPFATNLTSVFYGVDYNFRVYVTNSVGDAWSGVTNFSTLVPTPAWTPAERDVALWLDGDDASTVSLNGGDVSQWNDKSGNGRHVAQANAADQPAYSTGVISFNGSSDYLWNSSPFMYDNGEIDLFIVGSVASGTDDRIVAEGWTGGNNPVYCIAETHNSDATRMCAYLRNDANSAFFNHTYLSAAGAFDGTTKIYQWRDTGTSVSGRVNGGTETGGNYTRSGTMTLDRFAVGALLRGTPAVHTAADISEIVVCDNLSDTDRELFEGYLAHKWGLEADLPGGHPYESSFDVRGAILVGVTNNGAENIGLTSADLVGTLDATGSVFDVTVYWSENDHADAAAWLADGTASKQVVGTYTNVTGLSVTGAVTTLSAGTLYYYTMVASNDMTNIWATPNAAFGTVGPPVLVNDGFTPDIGTATLSAHLISTGGTPTVLHVYWGETDGGTTAGNWANTNIFSGYRLQGVYSTNTTAGLTYGVQYYFRGYASNANGGAWAPETSGFVTALPIVQGVPVTSGLNAHYDADKGITTDGSGVLTWEDQSGNGFTATRTGGTLTLLTGEVNGLPAVDFADYTYANINGSMFSKQQYVVFNLPNVAGDWGSVLGSQVRSGYLLRRQGNFWNGNYPEAVRQDGGSELNPSYQLSNMGSYTLVRITGNDNNTSVRVGWALGRQEGWYRLTMKLAEVISYDRTLSAEEEDLVGGYLAEKYGLTTGYTSYVPADLASIANEPVSPDFTDTSATFNATFEGVDSAFDVYVYWGMSDGGTNAGAWGNTNLVGSYTNQSSTGLSFSTNTLSGNTVYYYTFCARNAATNMWASPSETFKTQGAPTVERGAGAVAHVGYTTLNGVLTTGGRANITVCWGLSDAGTGSIGDWDNRVPMGNNLSPIPFATNTVGAWVGLTYYYRCYATNAFGEDWSDVESFTTLRELYGINGLKIYGYHINNDGLAMDLNNNGGMMGGGDPTTFQNFYGEGLLTAGPGNRGLDFNSDTDFIDTGAIGQIDNYSTLFLGYLNALTDGDYEFRRVNDDDRMGIWLDLDQDGVFESSTPGLGSNRDEQLQWDNDGGVKTKTLTVGKYMFAVTHREGGGGSQVDVEFKAPSMGGRTIIRPTTDANQDGMWLYGIEPSLTLAIANTSVSNVIPNKAHVNGTLSAPSQRVDVYVYWSKTDHGTDKAAWLAGGTGAYVGSYTNVTDALLTYQATGLEFTTNYYYTFYASNAVEDIWAEPSVNFKSFGVPTVVATGATAKDFEGKAVLNGAVTDGGGADVYVCWGYENAGTGDTSLWQNVEFVGYQTTLAPFATNISGVLYGIPYYYTCYATNVAGSDWSSVTNFSVGKKIYVSNGLRHYGYHTGPNGVMDLNNNSASGMMGGGDPTQGPTYYGQALLTSGPGNRGLDFDNDGDFTATGAIGQNDNYSSLFLGYFTPPYDADYGFRNAGDDDRAGIWLDMDQDGVFESSIAGLGTDRGEQVSWENTSWYTRTLTAGQKYMIAFTHSEGGGGSRCDFRFRGLGIAGEPIVKPAAVDQDGMWFYEEVAPFGITNTLPSNLAAGQARLNADLNAVGAVYDVSVYWSTTDHGTDASAWLADGDGAHVGWYTNVAASLSHVAGGLTDNQTYYYAFRGTNLYDEIWGDPAMSFNTLSAPTVNNGGGATDIGPGSATLHGELTAGGAADIYVCWGWVDGGANLVAWENVEPLGQKLELQPFSETVTEAYYGMTYYYRCYATNVYGSDWAPSSETFSTPTTARESGPRVTANMELWLQADAGVTTDGNGVVTRWADQSVNGRDMVSWLNTPTLEANEVNGLPAVRFNQSDENLQMDNPADIFFAKDVYLVFRSGNGANFGPDWGAPLGVKSGDDANRMWMFRPNDQNFWDQEKPDVVVRNGVNIPDVNHFDMNTDMGQYMVLKIEAKEGGSQPSSTGNGSHPREYIVGTRTDGWANSRWDTAEILVYNTALSAEDENTVGGYLAWKYGIASAYDPYLLPNYYTLTNSLPTDREITTATLNATASFDGAVFEAWAFWGATDGGTDPLAWASNAYVGPYTNLVDGNISYGISGLSAASTNFYTFCLSNDQQVIWASPSEQITAIAGPEVSNGVATAAVGGATLSGELTTGNVAHVYIYWGTTDGGTTKGNWDSFELLSDTPQGPFSTSVESGYGMTYYYRCYATNAAGDHWATATTNFVTLPPWADPELPVTAGLLYQLDAGSFEGLSDWASVSQWDDLSGNDRHFTEGNGSYQPIYRTDQINGRPAVRFDGGDDRLTWGSSTAPETVFIVNNVLSYGNLDGIWGSSNPSDKGIRLANATEWRNSDNNDYPRSDGDVYVNGTSTRSFGSVGLWHILMQSRGSSHTTPYYNTHLGGYYGGRYINADVAEVLVYDRDVTSEEHNQIGDYLAQKYGLTTPYTGYTPELAMSLTNDSLSDVSTTVATLNGTLEGTGWVFDVWAYWGETDGETNAGSWTHGARVGWYTNYDGTVSYEMTGLSASTAYYCTFRATNQVLDLWADPSKPFGTLGPVSVVNLSAGTLTATSAVLRAQLTSGGTADVTIYWGSVDRGASHTGWEHSESLPGVVMDPFETTVTVLAGGTYHYRTYATNAINDGWAASTESFTVPQAAASLSIAGRDAAFDPTSVGGCVLWISGDDIDGDGNTGNNPSDGADINLWFDKSGQGNHVQRTGQVDPTYNANGPNGRGVITFDADRDYMSTAYNFDAHPEYSIISVSRYTGGDNERVISSDTRDWAFGIYANVCDRWYAQGWVYSGSGSDTSWHIHAGRINNDADPEGDFWTDGVLRVLDSTGSGNGNHMIGRLGLGGYRDNNQESNCEIAEILIFDHELSNEELTRIGYYLDRKYNLNTAYYVDEAHGTFEVTASLNVPAFSNVTVNVDVGGTPAWGVLEHRGYHKSYVNSDLDLHNNGGLMAMTPYNAVELTDGPGGRGLDFNNDGDFTSSGAVAQNDNYMTLFIGYFNAPTTGNYDFRINDDDDRGGMWIDLDQDGVFESSPTGLGSDRGEQLAWENHSAHTVSLTGGESYRFAVTHAEGGGGSYIDVRVKTPSMSTEAVIKPTDPAQAGLWSVLTNGAAYPADLTGSTSIVITAGSLTGSTVLTPVDDTLGEENEGIKVMIASVVNATSGAPDSVVGIINSGDPTVTTGVGFTDVAAPDAVINGELIHGDMAEVTMYWGASDGGTDPGGWDATVSIGLLEEDETFSANITGLAGGVTYYYRCYATNGSNRAEDWSDVETLVMPGAYVSVSDVAVTEGDAGTVNAVFTISLSAPNGAGMSVDYATVDNTATDGSDYTGVSGTVTIPAWQTSTQVTVVVAGDTVFEQPHETFYMDLSGVVNGTIDVGRGVCTITDDDAAGYLADWRNRMKITFDGYAGGETLTNWPAVVRLAETIPGFDYDQFASAEGHDIRFANAAETEVLSFEIEDWDATGESAVWVKVPELPAGGAYIWAYWNNPHEATLPVYATNNSTWSEDYLAVWHMNGVNGSSEHPDSTSHGRDATDSGGGGGPTDITAAIAGGQDFDGSDDYCDSGESFLNHGYLGQNSDFTLHLWVYPHTVSGKRGYVGQNDRVEYGPDSEPRCWSGNTLVGSQITANQWKHLVLVADNAAMTLYQDGIFNASAGGATQGDSGYPVRIGGGGIWDASGNWFDGVIDEVRVCKAKRSGDWIKANYDNQAPGSTFNTFGPVEGKPAIDIVYAVSNLTATSADVSAALTSTGTAETTVTVYWGTNDAGRVPGNWDTSELYGTVTTVPSNYVKSLSGLLDSTQYYYTFAASNTYGTIWAASNFWTYGRPAVENTGADGYIAYAVMNGNVVSTGGAPTTVSIFWGDEDGGTGTWDHEIIVGPHGVGTFSASTPTNLIYGVEYYYRAYASNTHGGRWAPSSTAFTTLPPPTLPGTLTADGQTFEPYFEQHDGDSWLLIGRGREGWQFDTDGQGNVEDVVQGLGTPSAFAPACYSDAMLNDLLVQAGLTMPDVELRLSRASLPDGTGEYQDVRWSLFSGNGDLFTWQFDTSQYGLRLEFVNAPAGLAGAGTGVNNSDDSRDCQLGNDARRVFTWAWGSHNNQKGFCYGSSVGNGANTPTSFIWEYANENHAIPYTEVYMVYDEPPPIPTIGITNTAVANLGGYTATLQGELDATNATFQVYAYWGLTNGGANASAWASNAYVGTYTNVLDYAVSNNITGLTLGTTYYYTFLAQNAATNLWASPSVLFETLGSPTVSNQPPAVLGSALATVSGYLAKGGEADVTIYWGLTDEGTDAGAWDTATGGGLVYSPNAFSTNVTPLAGATYYYRCYATNAYGHDWADWSTNFITPGAAAMLSQIGTTFSEEGVIHPRVTATLNTTSAVDVTVNFAYSGTLPGATNVFVAGGLEHRGYHRSNPLDSNDMYLDNNGGLMAMTPYGIATLTSGPGDRGLDFNGDGDFTATGAIGQNDYYMNLFIGYFRAPETGNYEFKNGDRDDWAGMWIDLDRDGVFQTTTPGLGTGRGEQLAWNNGVAQTVSLTGGEAYMVAFTHAEGTGGSRCDFRIRTPSMSAEAMIKPTDPEQAGLWGQMYPVASYPSDYTVAPTSVVVSAGNLSGYVTLSAVNDSTPEDTEGVVVSYASAVNATSAVPQTYVSFTLTNGDPGVDNANGATDVASDGTATLNGTLNAGGSALATIYYGTTDGGTSTGAWDLSSSVGSVDEDVVFSAGVSGLTASQTYYYRCYVTNAASENWALSSTNFALPAAAVSVGDVTTVEGHSGTALAVFPITLSAPSALPISVNYATSDGTAAAGSDYTAVSGTLNITAGVSSTQLVVAVTGDREIEMPSEAFTMNLSVPVSCTIADSEGVCTITDDEGDAAFAGWARKARVTFSGYAGSETLENFTALVRVSESIPGFLYADVGSSEGHDLRFITPEGVVLYHEIENWDPTGESQVWLRVPELTASTTLWMYWGSASATLPAYATNGAAWSTDFAGVWHLADPDLSGDLPDSTANGNEGTIGSSTTTSGSIGTGREFAGANNTPVNCGNDTSMNMTDQLTLSGWMYPHTVGQWDGIIAKGNDADYELEWPNTTSMRGRIRGNATGNTPALSMNRWYQIVLSWEANVGYKLYVDGVVRNSGNIANAITPTANNVVLGSRFGGNTTFDGLLDEMRICRVTRSADWVQARYDNEVAGSTFVEYDAALDLRLPEVAIDYAVTNLAGEWAYLDASVTSTGHAETAVWLYWDQADGGTDPAAWGNTQFMGTVSALPPTTMSSNVTGLSGNTLYYYAYRVSNDYGQAWASTNFRTLVAPEVNNGTGPSVGIGEATLTGELTTGNLANIYIYWGQTDGGTDKGAWENVESLGIKGQESFQRTVSAFYGMTYYYRCYATNNLGDNWAPAATNFMTVDPTADNYFNALYYGRYAGAADSELGAIDDGVANGENGGLFDLTPDGGSPSIWTSEIWPGGDGDNYCKMWWGVFHPPLTGTYEFYVHGDDYELLWIDTAQNGEFEAGEDDISRNVPPENWNTPHTETAALTGEGQQYAFAIAFREGGGGDFMNITVTKPGGAAERINPSTPSQDGWWSLGYTVEEPAIANGVESGVTTTSATFGGTLDGNGTIFDVYAYWGTTDGGSDASAWASNAYVGTYTNADEVSLSYTAVGLATDAGHFYTFLATNDATGLWASPSEPFATLGALNLNNSTASNVTASAATIGAHLVAGGAGDTTLYWGPTDGGVNKGSWAHSIDFGTLSIPVSISTNLTGLLAGKTYYYRVYASNLAGEAWAASAESFSTIPAAATIDDVTVTEGDSGTVTAVFTVTLSAPSGSPVSLSVNTANGTAAAGDDYIAISGATLNIPVGAPSRTISVTVKGDGEGEWPSEAFSVNLGAPVNCTIADGQGICTITDDDLAAYLSRWGCKMKITFDDYSGLETLVNFPVLVRLSESIPAFKYSSFEWPENGADLRFSDATGATLLNHEIEKWDPSGTSYVWVQVPGLSADSHIWAYWARDAVPPASPLSGATDLEDCILWLDASDINGSGDGAAGDPGNGQTVATWDDRSFGDHDATQGTESDKPVVVANAVNGRSALRFDGANDYLVVADEPNFDLLRDMTVVVVAKADFAGMGSWEPYISKDGEGEGWQLRRQGGNNYATFTQRATSATDDPAGSTGINGQWRVLVGWYDGVRRKLIVDGNVDFDIADTGNISDNAAPVVIGARYNNYPNVQNWAGMDIAEAAIFSRALSDAELNRLGYYLSQKYGLSTSYTPDPVAVPPAYTRDGSTWSSEYLGVWHMHQRNVTDSTSAKNNGRSDFTSTTTGLMGDAQQFDNNWIRIPDREHFNRGDNVTASAWVRVDGGWRTSNQAFLSHRGEGSMGWQLRRLTNQDYARWTTRGLSNEDMNGTVGGIGIGTWKHIVGIFDGSTKYIYVDGELDSSLSVSGTINDVTDLNRWAEIGSKDNGGERHRGLIDEARIEHAVRSAEWIKARYDNEKQGSTFATYGRVDWSPRESVFILW